MKSQFILYGALLTTLSPPLALSQLILKDVSSGVNVSFSPGAGTGLISTAGINNGLKLEMDFTFNFAQGQMSILMTNYGNPLNALDTYNISHIGFNAPTAWGTVGLVSITPNTGGITGADIGPLTTGFGGYAFRTYVGSKTENGSAADKPGELGVDQGESVTMVFSFSTLNSQTFNLPGFFNGNGTDPDLGVRIQPMSPNPGSDKWILQYTYTTPPVIPPDIPPFDDIPEPATYGMAGFAALAALAAFRKLRFRR